LDQPDLAGTVALFDIHILARPIEQSVSLREALELLNLHRRRDLLQVEALMPRKYKTMRMKAMRFVAIECRRYAWSNTPMLRDDRGPPKATNAVLDLGGELVELAGQPLVQVEHA
jgi:hypothetical protein